MRVWTYCSFVLKGMLFLSLVLCTSVVSTVAEETLPSAKSSDEDQTIFCAVILQNFSEKKIITFANTHFSHSKPDGATALENITDTVNGNHMAHRSDYYDTQMSKQGPGGTVLLYDKMLIDMIVLAKNHTFTVSEIAGGVHRGPAHYDGKAFDITFLDGQKLFKANPKHKKGDTLLAIIPFSPDGMKVINNFEYEIRKLKRDKEALEIYDPVNNPSQEQGACIHIQWEPPAARSKKVIP